VLTVLNAVVAGLGVIVVVHWLSLAEIRVSGNHTAVNIVGFIVGNFKSEFAHVASEFVIAEFAVLHAALASIVSHIEVLSSDVTFRNSNFNAFLELVELESEFTFIASEGINTVHAAIRARLADTSLVHVQSPVATL